MTENTAQSQKVSVPVWFWVVSIVGLLWFLMDCSAFYMRLFPGESMANMPENQQMLYKTMPSWVNIVFAFEVFGGLLGSIGLLLRKKWALLLFIVSTLGVLCQSIYIWFLSDAIDVMGAMAIVMPVVALAIGVTMILFSKMSIARGWLN